MLCVHVVCCLSRRFCSSEARPSQYGSGDEVDVRGGVASAMVGDLNLRFVPTRWFGGCEEL